MSSTAAVIVSDVSPGDRDRMEEERLRMGTERDHMREERMEREREQESVDDERRGFHTERQRLQGELSDANQVGVVLSVRRQYHNIIFILRPAYNLHLFTIAHFKMLFIYFNYLVIFLSI